MAVPLLFMLGLACDRQPSPERRADDQAYDRIIESVRRACAAGAERDRHEDEVGTMWHTDDAHDDASGYDYACVYDMQKRKVTDVALGARR